MITHLNKSHQLPILLGIMMFCSPLFALGQDVLTIYGEPAYLMSDEEVKQEIVGKFYWQCAPEDIGGIRYFDPNHNTLAFTANLHGLIMGGEFVKTIYSEGLTGNINGRVPLEATYMDGNWYKQRNTKTQLTIYFLVGHKIIIESACYSNSQWVGNEITTPETSKTSFIALLKDEENRWAYYCKKGQYEMKKLENH